MSWKRTRRVPSQSHEGTRLRSDATLLSGEKRDCVAYALPDGYDYLLHFRRRGVSQLPMPQREIHAATNRRVSLRGTKGKDLDAFFCELPVHVVFSTKERRPFLTPEIEKRLWPVIGGIANKNKMKALKVGGVADHVHVLLSLPATLDTAKAMQLIKGNSSKWIHDEFREMDDFAWQEGYGAFSIGVSGIDDTVAYIENQAEHHRKKSFKEEFILFLEKHHIEYEDRMLD